MSVLFIRQRRHPLEEMELNPSEVIISVYVGELLIRLLLEKYLSRPVFGPSESFVILIIPIAGASCCGGAVFLL